MNTWICNEFLNPMAPIEKVYVSTFNPTVGLDENKKDDTSRMFFLGMILHAQQENNLDLETLC